MPKLPTISRDAGNPLLSNPTALTALLAETGDSTSLEPPESSASLDSPPNNIRDSVLALLLEELVNKKQEKVDAAEHDKRARKINLEGIRRVLAEKEDSQRHCPHKKPSGASALAGQRDHQGVEHMICQYCQAAFSGQEIPSHLRIDPSFVGGPVR